MNACATNWRATHGASGSCIRERPHRAADRATGAAPRGWFARPEDAMSGGPQRIVCLTEEPTEVLYAIGEQHRIVGISGFTVRPARARKEKPKVSAFTSAKIGQILA